MKDISNVSEKAVATHCLRPPVVCEATLRQNRRSSLFDPPYTPLSHTVGLRPMGRASVMNQTQTFHCCFELLRVVRVHVFAIIDQSLSSKVTLHCDSRLHCVLGTGGITIAETSVTILNDTGNSVVAPRLIHLIEYRMVRGNSISKSFWFWKLIWSAMYSRLQVRSC